MLFLSCFLVGYVLVGQNVRGIDIANVAKPGQEIMTSACNSAVQNAIGADQVEVYSAQKMT